MSLFCTHCQGLLQSPRRLTCGHRQCQSCVDQLTTEIITCVICHTNSWRSEVVIDEDLRNRIEQLMVICIICRWSGSLREFRIHSHLSQMVSDGHLFQESNINISANRIRCPLYNYGCTNSFLPSQLLTHYSSETHSESRISKLYRIFHEIGYIINDAKVYPPPTNGLSSAEHTALLEIINTCEQYINQFSNPPVSSNSPVLTSNILSNTPFSSAYQAGREQILNMDRNSNNHTDLQSLQDQRQSNRKMIGVLSSHIDRLSTSDGTCHNTEQGQLAQDSPPVNEHNVNKSLICEHLSRSNEIRQGTSENVCVLKTGHASSKNGDLLRACIYLNDTINPTFISIHVHSNLPIDCHNQLKFRLVDQNTNQTFNHITKSCANGLNSDNNCFDCKDFIAITELRTEGNRFLLNGNAVVSIQIEQQNEQKVINLPACIQNALGLQ